MRIVQISDLNIAAKGDDTPRSVTMLDNLVSAIASINQFAPSADLVLITGNITGDGSIEASMHAREILDGLKCPYKLVPGPNDDRQNLFGTFADKAVANEVGGVLSYVVQGFPIRCIGLDSLGHHGVGGRVCPKRLNWLNEHLASDVTIPTVIFTHHIPVSVGLPTDVEPFDNGDQLGAVIAQYSNVKRLLCGQINVAVHVGWHGTIVTSAPSMGMASGLADEGGIQAAYHLHDLTDQGELVTRSVPVG